MAHHGYDPEAERMLKEMQQKIHGEFPEGRLNASDDGAVSVGVGHQDGKVVLQFPHRLNWVGMTPQQAVDLAQSLIEHARSAGFTEPLVLTLGQRR